MAFSKIIYDGVTLMDVTDDTVSTSTLVSPATATKNDGTQITGGVSFVTYYTGSSTPSSATGSNGDIYLKTGS